METKTVPTKFDKVDIVDLDVTRPGNLKPSTGVSGGRFSRVAKWVGAVLTVLAIVFGGAMLTSTPANAGAFEDWTCDAYRHNVWANYGGGTTNTTPEVASLGILSSLISLNEGNDKLTAYEIFGTAGTNFTQWYSIDNQDIKSFDFRIMLPDGTIESPPKPGGEKEGSENTSPYWAQSWMDCTGITGALGNGIANYSLSITEVGVTIINFVYSIAIDGYQFAVQPLWDTIDDIIATLNDTLYIPFVVVFIMLGALWLAYKGLWKRQSTEALQGALWMIGATIAGMMMIVSPSFIPNLADDLVGKTQAIVANSITNVGTDEKNALCTVDGDLTYSKSAGGDGSTVSTGVRKTQCAVWYNLVYTPWVTGQFGQAPNSQKENAKYVVGSDVNTETAAGEWVEEAKDNYPVRMGKKLLDEDQVTWPLLQLNAQSANLNTLSAGTGTQKTRYYASSIALTAYNELEVNRNSTWDGKWSWWNRITVSNTSVIAMVATAILVIFFSMLLIAYQLMMLLLIMLMPFFLLVGVHPGWGRRIATRWAELIVNLTIKRMVLAVLLGTFLMFYGIIMGSSMIWLLQNVMIAAITIVGLSYRNKINELFASVDFGGDKRIGGESGGKGKNFMNRVAGAAIGAGIGVSSAKVGLAPMKASGELASNAAGKATSVAGNATKTLGKANNAGKALSTNSGAPTGKTPGGGKAVGGAMQKARDQQQAARDKQAKEARVARINKENERIADAKKRAIRSAALSGAAQGASGGVRGALLGSSMVGFQIGDGAHDNEVQRQLNDDLRESNENHDNVTSDQSAELAAAADEDFFTSDMQDANVRMIDEGTSTGRHAGAIGNGTGSTESSTRAQPAFEVQTREEAQFVRKQQQEMADAKAEFERNISAAAGMGVTAQAARQSQQDAAQRFGKAKQALQGFKSEWKPASGNPSNGGQLPPREK